MYRSLKNSGQYLGSSGLVCHIRRNDESNRRFYINIASCGDIAAVLCRAGEAMCLTQSHTVVDDREEASRIFRSDGIITEVYVISNMMYVVCSITCDIIQ